MMTPVAHVCAFTHRGRVRAQNEDTIVVGGWVSPAEMDAPRTFRHPISAPLLCAVADGMGGHLAGEVASRHVGRRLADTGEYLVTAQRLRATLSRVNNELYEMMEKDQDLAGMGTTVAGLVLARPLLWVNIGDSRIYRAGEDGLSQLSIDDTPPGPRTGRITQSLGAGDPDWPLHPHFGEEALSVPARFLLCSDGLTDTLSDEEIADCLALPDGEAVLQLFDHAMRAGGTDNVSIVLVRVEEGV
ncbi:MAG: protein phosphatase 2C domain-containing protein [Pseudorhodoplanes sp.]|nr:protein phosphatase 2C domain-containing protein [Pseudorhodoplanes sp.]